MDKKDKKIISLKLDVENVIPPAVAEEKLLESKESNKELTQKKSNKSKFLSFIFLFINIVVVFVIALIEFTNENRQAEPFSSVITTWGVNYKFLLIILALVFAFYALDTLKLSLMLKASTDKFRFGVSLKSCVMCRYYDNITPFGSGGQPFQMYYLSRKIPIGHATSLPIINFFITQLSFFCLCVVDFIFFPANVSRGVSIMAYAGAFFYMIVPILAVLFSLMPRLIERVLGFVVKIGAKMHLIKNPEKKLNKWKENVLEYKNVFRLFYKNILIMLLVFIFSVVQVIVLHSIPYFVLRACGVNNVDWWSITVMTTYIYAAITFIPTPGNSGAAEGTFYALFAVLGGYLFWGMLLWRFAVFYITILLGLAFILLDSVKKYKRLSHISNAMNSELPSNDKLPQKKDDPPSDKAPPSESGSQTDEPPKE